MKNLALKTQQFDHYLRFIDAATVLGSGNHTRITALVKEGKLPAYSLPLTPKLRVKKSELLGLIHPSSSEHTTDER
jgi:hypothetical protein